MSRKLVVTGGAGFIGANFVLQHLADFADDEVVVVDALTYAGNLENLAAIKDDERFRFERIDIRNADAVTDLIGDVQPQSILHFAAESHVDQSILGPRVFVETNVLGTQVLLDAARAHGVDRFLMVSTDEVYGDLGADGLFTEQTPLSPNNPYSASKASADLICQSYARTFGMDVVITRCCNNYGPYQFPEKLIPLMIINALENRDLPVYGDGMQVRDWIHVEDHCRGIESVLASGKSGEVYNIGARNEHYNLDIVKRIVRTLDKSESLITHVNDRPGHDRRYAIDPSKIENELGWQAKHTGDDWLDTTIRWYLDNQTWWEHIRSGDYRDYYERQYGDRLRSASEQGESA